MESLIRTQADKLNPSDKPVHIFAFHSGNFLGSDLHTASIAVLAQSVWDFVHILVRRFCKAWEAEW